MSNFDEWFKKKFEDLHEAICCGDLVANNYRKAIKKGFEAGAASRQAEVDELQKRIDTLSKKVNEMAHIFLDDLEGILKGERVEH